MTSRLLFQSRLQLERLAHACSAWLAAVARVLLGVLREIGDENAYARYLRANGLTHSARAWRAFSDERLRAKYVRPRCC